MHYFLRIIRLIFLGMGLTLSACKYTSVLDLGPVFTKKMIVTASYDQEWQYPMEGGTDWKNFSEWEETFQLPYDLLMPRQPEGLHVQLYWEDGSSKIFNIDAEGGDIPFTDDDQSLLLYNNNTEFIVFDHLQSLTVATATTRSRNTGSRPAGGAEEEFLEDARTTPDMLYARYINSYKGSEHDDVESLSVTLKPLVFSYLIQFECSKGLEHVEKARGALHGMANAVSLSTYETASETATLMFNCTKRSFALQALVRSFGVPDYPSCLGKPTAHDFTVGLEVLLHNGNTETFLFDVTDQVKNQPRGGVIRITGIEIKNESSHTSHNAGFDTNVSDWGDFEDIEFPL